MAYALILLAINTTALALKTALNIIAMKVWANAIVTV